VCTHWTQRRLAAGKRSSSRRSTYSWLRRSGISAEVCVCTGDVQESTTHREAKLLDCPPTQAQESPEARTHSGSERFIQCVCQQAAFHGAEDAEEDGSDGVNVHTMSVVLCSRSQDTQSRASQWQRVDAHGVPSSGSQQAVECFVCFGLSVCTTGTGAALSSCGCAPERKRSTRRLTSSSGAGWWKSPGSRRPARWGAAGCEYEARQQL
jgi:hypothetical protein